MRIEIEEFNVRPGEHSSNCGTEWTLHHSLVSPWWQTHFNPKEKCQLHWKQAYKIPEIVKMYKNLSRVLFDCLSSLDNSWRITLVDNGLAKFTSAQNVLLGVERDCGYT